MIRARHRSRKDGGGNAPGISAPTSAPATSNLTGKFLSWEPVHEANGDAHFSVTNNGTSAAAAKCSISVRNDFGNFGFDSLVGETVAPGQTITGKIPISVSRGSFLINSGDVKDC